MRKSVAIVAMCCAFALMLGLVACGGSGSSSAASASVSPEAKAALDEGIGYWFGTGENGFDKEKARAAFQRAADGGNAEGWYWLGVLRSSDTDAGRVPQVLDYYQKAIDNGCSKGYYGLGGIYRTGWDVERDTAKAEELFQKAVDDGELLGYIGLGGFYAKDDGEKAVECFEKAAASDDFDTRNAARCALGSLYFAGTKGVEPDSAKAIRFYQEAADENYSGGWNGLGTVYGGWSADVQLADDPDSSEGLEVDLEKVFEYRTKEAACGSPTNLANSYRDGFGCEINYPKAIELYNQAIDNGKWPATSMCCLAIMAANGWGMDQDFDVAADWCRKAIDAASPGEVGAIEYAKSILKQLEELE